MSKKKDEKAYLLRKYAVIAYTLEKMLPDWIDNADDARKLVDPKEQDKNNLCAVQKMTYVAIQKFMQKEAKRYDEKHGEKSSTGD